MFNRCWPTQTKPMTKIVLATSIALQIMTVIIASSLSRYFLHSLKVLLFSAATDICVSLYAVYLDYR